MKEENMNIPVNFPLPVNKSVWVLEQQAHETKTKSGIIIPDLSATGAANEGTKGVGIVYAMGPNVQIQIEAPEGTRNLQLGDKVLFNLYADKGISIDGYFYIMMHETDIYSILPDEDMMIARKEKIDRRRAAVERKIADAGGA